MIVYGTWTRKPATMPSTSTTPSPESTNAATRRPRLGGPGGTGRARPAGAPGPRGSPEREGSSGAGAASPPPASAALPVSSRMPLRSRSADTVGTRGPTPGSDCHAGPPTPHAAQPGDARRAPRLGTRAGRAPRRVHRLPRRGGAGHDLRGARHRHQRQAAVTHPGTVARAAAVAALAHDRALDARELAEALAATTDADAGVRAAALGALARGAPPDRARAPWSDAMRDPSPAVRRRAAELAGT